MENDTMDKYFTKLTWPNERQIEFGRLLGLNLDGHSLNVARAMVLEAFQKEFDGVEQKMATAKQIELGKKFNFDFSNFTAAIASAHIKDILEALNYKSIDEQDIKPGDCVVNKYDENQIEYIVSSITELGHIFFKNNYKSKGAGGEARYLVKINKPPEAPQTPESCLATVKQDGRALHSVPEDLKTPELCLAAVRHDGLALKYVPKALKTPEACLAAVKQDGLALKYVPKALKTTELCLAAVKKDGSVLEDVPEDLRTAELCFTAVKWHGSALCYVPEDLKTSELCLAAVEQDSSAIQYVPEDLREQVEQARGADEAENAIPF